MRWAKLAAIVSRYEDNSAGRKRLAADCYDRVLGRRVSSELSEEENGLEGNRIRV